MRPAELVGVLGAAYSFDEDDATWLESVARSLRPFLDSGQGIHAFLFDLSEPSSAQLDVAVGVGLSPEWERRWRGDWWDGFMRLLPVKSVHAMMTHSAFNRSVDLWSDIARTDPQFMPPALVDHSTESARGGIFYPDSVNVLAIDATGLGCAFAANRLTPTSDPVDPATGVDLAHLSTHIAAAYRLRRRGPGSRSLDAAAAIISPELEVLHADSTASGNRSLVAIRQAARALETIRSEDAPPQDPAAALAAWRALTAGEWTVLDQFDEDGRRYYIARPNAAVGPTLGDLSERELQVAHALALGHSNKLIAYELGLHPSTVSQHIASAARKLGVSNRIELVRRLRRRLREGG